MSKVRDLLGLRFNKLYVLEQGESDKKKNAQWLCVCNCGNKVLVRSYQLTSGKTQSCGCITIDRITKLGYEQIRHGHYKGGKSTKLARTWAGMKQRCHNPKDKNYNNYGARGIKVCDRWRYSFTNFLEDIKEPIDLKMQLDRINNNGDYEPSNCRWVSCKDNMNNRDNSYKTKRQSRCTHMLSIQNITFNYCPLCGMNVVALQNPDGSQAGVVNG